jgi:polysaccharide export outer membrane protein
MIRIIHIFLVLLFLTLSSSVFAQEAKEPLDQKQASDQAAAQTNEYVLGIGDKLKLGVFGEPDLTGEFEISSTGMMSVPLIGDIKAQGSTISALKSTITSKLSDGYMKKPKVSYVHKSRAKNTEA